ncbi:MAG: hypothetical protein AAFV29_24710, partial [Myxococcota bacterium]
REYAELLPIVRDHLPPVLVQTAQDRLHQLPAAYRDNIIAARLGAGIIYREGLDFLSGIPDADLGPHCLRYYRCQVEAERLATEVSAAGGPHAARVAELLRLGGPRAAMNS